VLSPGTTTSKVVLPISVKEVSMAVVRGFSVPLPLVVEAETSGSPVTMVVSGTVIITVDGDP
jgi:hypothetical protein